MLIRNENIKGAAYGQSEAINSHYVLEVQNFHKQHLNLNAGNRQSRVTDHH